MNGQSNRYCLDTNVLIEAWNKYYSPHFCSAYWDVLNKLGSQDRIFIPNAVYNEISRQDDELSKWLKGSNIPIMNVDAAITNCVKTIFEYHPSHKYLVDNTKNRSLADPWVIAHAINENACVVTKEEKITVASARENKVKIPNVCDNMGIRWINDFQLIKELNINFSCSVQL